MNYINDKKLAQVIRVMFDHVDGSMALEDIAKMSGLSLASLKRLFAQGLEMSPGAFMRRLRMQMAFRSLQSREQSILDVALASGFQDQSAFSRRFKEMFGRVPSHARDVMNIVREMDCVELEEPEIIEMTLMNLYCITEVGLYFEAAPRAWEKLKRQLTAEELSDDFMGVFIGIGHDNPHEGVVKEDQVRFSACISHVDRQLDADTIVVSGGRYARFRYVGKPTNLGLAYHYIFGKWQESTSWSIDTVRPAFILFDAFPDAFSEKVLMIHVPLIEAS